MFDGKLYKQRNIKIKKVVNFSNTYGKKVVLVDGNLSNANLGLQIGVVNPNVTLHHVLNNKASISEEIYEHEYGFSIIPSSLLLEETNPMKLKNHLIELRRYFDVILIDSSPTVNRELEAVMTVSDELFVITNPDYQTLLITVRAVKMAKKKNVHITSKYRLNSIKWFFSFMGFVSSKRSEEGIIEKPYSCS